MQPMLATRAPSAGELPRGPEWSYEIKWDGVRVLADTTDGWLRLRGRSGRDVTVTYPELAGLESLQGALVDGEVVVMRDGIPSFEALAERMNVRDPARAARLAHRAPVVFIAFDLLTLYGVELVRSPLTERRATLERLTLPDRVLLSPTYPDLDELWEATRQHGLEGVVAKRLTSTYQPGRRSRDWWKATHRLSRTAAVIGWRPEGFGGTGRASTSRRLGAVLLGTQDERGDMRYLGKAGSGLSGRRGAELLSRITEHPWDAPPLWDEVPDEDARGVSWCQPFVYVDVTYLNRMSGGRLRHPVVTAVRPWTDGHLDYWEVP